MKRTLDFSKMGDVPSMKWSPNQGQLIYKPTNIQADPNVQAYVRLYMQKQQQQLQQQQQPIEIPPELLESSRRMTISSSTVNRNDINNTQVRSVGPHALINSDVQRQRIPSQLVYQNPSYDGADSVVYRSFLEKISENVMSLRE